MMVELGLGGIQVKTKNLPKLADKFLAIVRDFGYPDLTMEVFAKDEFYHKVVRNLLHDEIHEGVIERVLTYIKETYK